MERSKTPSNVHALLGTAVLAAEKAKSSDRMKKLSRAGAGALLAAGVVAGVNYGVDGLESMGGPSVTGHIKEASPNSLDVKLKLTTDQQHKIEQEVQGQGNVNPADVLKWPTVGVVSEGDTYAAVNNEEASRNAGNYTASQTLVGEVNAIVDDSQNKGSSTTGPNGKVIYVPVTPTGQANK